MADYSAIRTYFDSHKLNYFTFYAKSEKPIKAVIRHLPIDTPAEDISNGLVDLGFYVISVKQTTTTRSSESGRKQINPPLFLITLMRNEKSQTIFKLNGLCHIAIRVEAYKAQNNITQRYNCQKFGHIGANCRQPPRCTWCGGGHLHKDCPEAEKENSTPNCCNCSLQEGEQPYPSSYRGFSHAKEKLLRRKNQSSLNKGAPGRTLSSNYVTPGQSFAAALRRNPGQQPPIRQAQLEQGTAAEPMREPPPAAQQAKPAGQPVQTSNVNSVSLDHMFKVATVVQQITTELNGAVSEEEKIVAITKIVLNLMKRDDH
jgi:hypothetical protein